MGEEAATVVDGRDVAALVAGAAA
ncbi:MAG: hypothetical protein QOG03_966, partial [Actinomycetota bacterium]|nr:hypothetical protein [Actinomycetota bacterium]